MIPQPFVKGGGERVFFGQFEYPPNADIVFDFGNPLCTSAFNSGRIVYNAATQNVTGSLIPYNNPGPIYPTLESTNGGTVIFSTIAFGTNYMQWDYSTSVEQTSVSIFKLNGDQGNSYNSYIPADALTGSNGIEIKVSGQGVPPQTSSALITVSYIANTTSINTLSTNGTNGYNILSAQANGSTTHNLYVNNTLTLTDNNNTPRISEAEYGIRFGYNSNMRAMAYLQYPRILKPKEIRQIYKVFSKRFFT